MPTDGMTNINEVTKPEDLFELLASGKIKPGQMNDLAMKIGDTGNEGVLGVMMERMRASGGRAGFMHTLADDVNDATAARSGSMEVDIGGRSYSGMPSLITPEDLEPASAAVFEQMQEAGIPTQDLIEALAAGGPDDHRATFQAFHTLAEENGLNEVASFVQGADAYAHGLEGAGAMPIVGTEVATVEAAVLEMDDAEPSVSAFKMI